MVLSGFWGARRREARADAARAETRAAIVAELVAMHGEGGESLARLMGIEDLPEGATYREALKLPPVFAAVQFLSSCLASLPVRIMQDGREVKAHPVAHLFNVAASDEVTAFEARQALHAGQFGPGRGFLQIERDRRGDPSDLFVIDPGAMAVGRNAAGRLVYQFHRVDGRSVTYRASEVLDLAFRKLPCGVRSVCPVEECATAIRQGLNAQRYAVNTYGRMGIPPYVLEGPHGSGASAKRAADDVSQAAADAVQTGRPLMPLPSGFKLTRIGSDPDSMMLIPTQVFTVQQVARIYGLPPLFLQDLTSATYGNAEQQDLHLVKHLLQARAVQAGQEMTLKLFGRKSSLSVEFDLQAITRGLFKDRIEALARGINSGQFTPNEARQMRGADPLPGGDSLMMQSATLPLDVLVEKMRADMARGPSDQSPVGSGGGDGGAADDPAPEKEGGEHGPESQG